MARSTRQAPPTKNPAYQPKRIDDRPVFWAYSIVDRLTWPITVFFLLFIGGISAVWLRFGEARAVALMSFLQDNVFYAVVSLLAMATVAVLRKVPQLGRFEKRQAATQQEVEQARVVSEQVLAAVKSQPASREPDPTTGEVAALVQKIAGDMSTINERLRRVEDGTLAAARASSGAAAAVSGYGESLQTIARGVSAVTGQTPAQRPPEPAPGPEWPGSRYGRPEARLEPQEAREDWTRRDGSHRADTSLQAAVPGVDEQEDWQEPADDGLGLDTGYRADFREQMAAAAAREAAVRARQQGPAPIWPSTQPVADDDLPPHIQAARQRAREQQARERADAKQRRARWTNPEEGN